MKGYCNGREKYARKGRALGSDSWKKRGFWVRSSGLGVLRLWGHCLRLD